VTRYRRLRRTVKSGTEEKATKSRSSWTGILSFQEEKKRKYQTGKLGDKERLEPLLDSVFSSPTGTGYPEGEEPFNEEEI